MYECFSFSPLLEVNVIADYGVWETDSSLAACLTKTNFVLVYRKRLLKSSVYLFSYRGFGFGQNGKTIHIVQIDHWHHRRKHNQYAISTLNPLFFSFFLCLCVCFIFDLSYMVVYIPGMAWFISHLCSQWSSIFSFAWGIWKWKFWLSSWPITTRFYKHY